MTASVPNRHSPMAEVKKGVLNMGSFAVDQNFLQNQTIKVFVRLKPSLDEEEDGKRKIKDDKGAWDIKKMGDHDAIVERGVLRKVDGKNSFNVDFNVDQVFDENAQTPFLYKSIARSMVHTVLSGKHATIFAYGETGAGYVSAPSECNVVSTFAKGKIVPSLNLSLDSKTHTMQGDGGGHAGIIQSVFSDIFRFSRMGEHSSRNFTIIASYVEVYNESVRDLLSDDAGDNYSQGTPTGMPVDLNRPEVQIQKGAAGEVLLNCITKEIHTVEDALEVLDLGNSNRVVAKTNANIHSSRSHAIFRINVQSSSKEVGPGAEILRIADFNLVDLAGSEAANAVGTNPTRQKESAKINQGLLSLSNIIHDLSLPEKKRPKHISYRDSKLTQILEPHLSGNAEMAIILCVYPTKSFLEETRSTFKFGSRAKMVIVNPAVNELNDESALIKKLQAELRRVKQQLDEYKREGVPSDTPKSIGVSKVQSTAMSDIQSLDTKSINYDEVSLGYDDMDAGPGHREYDFVSNQEMPPPKNWEDGEKIPGMGGREYVMPKNMAGLPPELQEAQLARPSDDDSSGPGLPLLPNAREFSDIPLDLGKDFAEHDAPYRNSSVDVDMMLKGDDVESDVDLYSSDGNLSARFDLNMMVEPDDARAAQKYLQQTRDTGDTNSADHGSGNSSGYGSGSGQQSGTTASRKYKTGSRLDQTGPTEDVTYDGPERSFAGMSEKFGSGMSKPDTLRMASVGAAPSRQTTIATFDNFNARHGNQVSWDTIDLDIMLPEHAGKPLKAIHTLYHREAAIPEEITIMRLSIPDNAKDEICLTHKLIDAETRSKFMENRLEMADDLVEGIFKDLERARLCIHDLVDRNAQLSAKLKEKRREDIKEAYQQEEVVVEQYWMLKGAMYVGLFFFISGGYEFFMASVFLVWLILEINLGEMT